MRVQLAGSTGGQNHRVGVDPLPAPGDVRGPGACRDVADQQLDTRDAPSVEHQVDQEGVFDHADVARAQPRDECLLDRGAGRVAPGVEDARVRVRGFETLDERTVRAAVECDAEVDQLADAGGTLVDEDPDRLGIAQTGAGGQRVADVVFGAIVGEHHAGDPALRVAGVGVLEHVLGHEGDPAAVFDRVQRHREAGDPAADHDGVQGGGGGHEAFSHPDAGAAGGLAASIRSRARRAGSATSCGTVMRLSTSPFTSPSSTHAR